MTMHPAHHPSAVLAGAAPHIAGVWVSVWTSVDGVLGVTVGDRPGDGPVFEPVRRYPTEAAARDAAVRRLNAQWDRYLADTPCDRRAALAALPAHAAAEAPLMFARVDEGPVTEWIARAAIRAGIVLGPNDRAAGTAPGT